MVYRTFVNMGKPIFNTKDFTDLKYKVFEKEPSKIKELSVLGFDKINRPDKDNLIRYVMAMYDQRSPVIRVFTDLAMRKKESAIVSGYDLDKDQAILTGLFDMTDTDLQELTMAFLKEENIFEWSMIVSNEQVFYELQKALITEVVAESKDKLQSLQLKGKIMDECDTIAERVARYYQKVFGDEELANKAKQTKKFTPESQAKRG